MRFYCKNLDVKMELSIEKINCLVIESPRLYREVVQNLQASIDEDNEEWIFSDNEKILKKSTLLDVIDSLFYLDFDSRKIQGVIVEQAYRIATNESYFEKTKRLASDIEAYMYELDWELEYETKVNEIDMKNIIKLGIGEIDKKENLVERLDDYVKISSRVLHNKVLVLLGISGWFDTDEWKQIQRTARYEEMYLLCIENRDVFAEENKIIIDLDGCRVI